MPHRFSPLSERWPIAGHKESIMVGSDPIGDMLTRLRNASLVRKPEVRMPHSRVKEALAKVLSREGYVGVVSSTVGESKPELVVKLRYDEKQVPAIRGITRVSKPGQRIYVPKKKIPRIQQGLGTAVLSTPQGLLTDREARKKGTGGEVICTIW